MTNIVFRILENNTVLERIRIVEEESKRKQFKYLCFNTKDDTAAVVLATTLTEEEYQYYESSNYLIRELNEPYRNIQEFVSGVHYTPIPILNKEFLNRHLHAVFRNDNLIKDYELVYLSLPSGSMILYVKRDEIKEPRYSFPLTELKHAFDNLKMGTSTITIRESEESNTLLKVTITLDDNQVFDVSETFVLEQ